MDDTRNEDSENQKVDGGWAKIMGTHLLTDQAQFMRTYGNITYTVFMASERNKSSKHCNP